MITTRNVISKKPASSDTLDDDASTIINPSSVVDDMANLTGRSANITSVPGIAPPAATSESTHTSTAAAPALPTAPPESRA
jgi:hypothetical protein